jgi:hypothetical protein
VRRGHFLQRIDRALLRCIDDIIKNAQIVERFACLIIARRRGPREPLALAALAALRGSLRELAIEEAKPRHHCIVSSVDDNFFRLPSSRLRSISFLYPHALIFGNKSSGCSRSMLGLMDFVRRRSVGLPCHIIKLIVMFLPSLCTPKHHCWLSFTLDLWFVA